jgi:hypothetical protein
MGTVPSGGKNVCGISIIVYDISTVRHSEFICVQVLYSWNFALLLTAAGTLRAEDFPFENPLTGKEGTATFTKTSDPKSRAEATRVQVSDKNGAVLLQQDLAKQDVQSARWTEDGKFLIITSRNSEGHSPWRFTVDVFSVDAREFRLLSDEKRPPCISSEIWCQTPIP